MSKNKILTSRNEWKNWTNEMCEWKSGMNGKMCEWKIYRNKNTLNKKKYIEWKKYIERENIERKRFDWYSQVRKEEVSPSVENLSWICLKMTPKQLMTPNMMPLVKNAPRTTIHAQNPPSSSVFSSSLKSHSLRSMDEDSCIKGRCLLLPRVLELRVLELRMLELRVLEPPLRWWLRDVCVDPSAVPALVLTGISELNISSSSPSQIFGTWSILLLLTVFLTLLVQWSPIMVAKWLYEEHVGSKIGFLFTLSMSTSRWMEDDFFNSPFLILLSLFLIPFMILFSPFITLEGIMSGILIIPLLWLFINILLETSITKCNEL